MKTSIRSLEGSNGLSAGVRRWRPLVAPNSLTATSRHAILLAPICEQSGLASARASRQLLQTIVAREAAIPLPREDCCHVEVVISHYPVDIGVGVSRDDDDDAPYETGPPRTALTDVSSAAHFRGGKS